MLLKLRHVLGLAWQGTTLADGAGTAVLDTVVPANVVFLQTGYHATRATANAARLHFTACHNLANGGLLA